MLDLSDPNVLEAVALVYEAASEARRIAQAQVEQADRLFGVASALHDLTLNARLTVVR